jgi:hypothetical protein
MICQHWRLLVLAASALRAIDACGLLWFTILTIIRSLAGCFRPLVQNVMMCVCSLQDEVTRCSKIAEAEAAVTWSGIHKMESLLLSVFAAQFSSKLLPQSGLVCWKHIITACCPSVGAQSSNGGVNCCTQSIVMLPPLVQQQVCFDAHSLTAVDDPTSCCSCTHQPLPCLKPPNQSDFLPYTVD